MPRNLAGRILEAAGIAEPPPQGHPEGVPSGPTFQTRRGIAVAAASVSYWGVALGLDIQIQGTPGGRAANLRRKLLTRT